MAGLRFFEKIKKIEIQEIEKKIASIHKSVLSNFVSLDILKKDEIIVYWKKINISVTDVKANVTQFFDNYKNFEICDERNLLIGEYFIYLIIFLKNAKIKNNPFRVINFYIFTNNKWKDKLIFHFLKNIFLKDYREHYNMSCKTLVIEYIINNHDIFNEHNISMFYTDILWYINNKLKINFLKKNQNYLNIFANFLITFNGNATLELKWDMLEIFFLISKNLKKILLQFPFDKDICTHVCLIYQQVKNIVINYERNILHILSEQKNSYVVLKEQVSEKQKNIENKKCTIEKKNYENYFHINVTENGTIPDEKYLTKTSNKKKYRTKTGYTAVIEENEIWSSVLQGLNRGVHKIGYGSEIEFLNDEYEKGCKNKCQKNKREDTNENGILLDIAGYNIYLSFIKKIKEMLEECNNVIKEKKKENPFLILCKYRSILIIKYKNVKNVSTDDNLDYFVLFFKIKNLLCGNSKNPFFIFLCIESINFWLQKNEGLQYIFECVKDYFPTNKQNEKSFSYKSESNNCTEECVKNDNLLSKKNCGNKKFCENDEVMNEQKNNFVSRNTFSKINAFENNLFEGGNDENIIRKKGCTIDELRNNEFHNHHCDHHFFDEGGNIKDGRINFFLLKNGGKNAKPERELYNCENVSLTDLSEIVNSEESVNINNLKIYFNYFSDEKKIEFLKELYAIIIKSILQLIKKYSLYNIKIIWKSCIGVYELLLTSKKNTFIKKDVYNNLTYIIFYQEKKKKYLCLSLLLKYSKEFMCHKNVLEYLFYCFFQKDDFFLFSLYELIKQCIKHIFTHVEDKYLLYCIFVKNILITDSFCMKTFYIKKFIELFYKSDNNYLYFIINKEYYRLKTYFDNHKEKQIIKNRPAYCTRHSDINVDNFICVNNMMKGRKELINEQYFQYLRNQLLEINKSEEIWYNHITYKKEENIFFNYKIVKMEIEKYGGRYTCELEEMKVEKYYLYNFHCIEKIIYLELYTLCTLRKYEHIEIVNYKNDYFYQLCGDFLLNVKTLKNFFYFSNDEVILSILSFICENKYLNICDLYLFLTFLTTSITNITRTNRDSYKKYILLFFEKFFVFYQRMIELDRRNNKKEKQGGRKKNLDQKDGKNDHKMNENNRVRNCERTENTGEHEKIYYEEGNKPYYTYDHTDILDLRKAIRFLYGSSTKVLNADISSYFLKSVYSTCILYSSNGNYVNVNKGIFLYNYYLMNIIFILFKSTNKDMSIEVSVYCSDILNTIVDYFAYFDNINFFFFLFNVKTTWKEFYLISKEIFFKTASIILLKKQNLECLNKSFIPLMKSHRQVDHSFFAFLLKLCYISINCNSNITEKNKMNLLNNTNTNGSSSNNMTFINVHSLKLFVKEDVLSCNFFNHLNKFSDIGNNIRGNNTYLTNYINYLLSDNCKYNMSRNIYLYILENFINKIKKESIVKLTRHKDIENSEMYKLAYYINEFVSYLKDNINFNKEIENVELFRSFCEISLCKCSTYLNFDKYKLVHILINNVSASYSYLLLLKVHICTILYYLFNYLNILFLSSSNNFFYDCRGHLIFEKENEKEATSIIIWLSIKYICTLITSIVDFSFKFNIKYCVNCYKWSPDKESILIDKISTRKYEGEKNIEAENVTLICENKNISICFFNKTEIHFIIQNLLCLLLYSKHVACQQYLADCLLDVCKIIVIKTNEDMQTIPLFYIYIILHIFKSEKNTIKCIGENVNINEANMQQKEVSTNDITSNKSQQNIINDSYSIISENNNSNNFKILNRIIVSLNKKLTSKDENNVDISEFLSINFSNSYFNTENNEGGENMNINVSKNKNTNVSKNKNTNVSKNKNINRNYRIVDEKGNVINGDSCSKYFHDQRKFEINEKLNKLILDNKKINRNFLRKSSNMCLALSSLAKSYRIKEQYIIYNFIIRITLNYLYNGNNKYKKVICLNIIKHIYTIIDNKTLYEYINDIYKISLIYYKSKFFCLKSSSTSLYNILTKRLLAKLNYSYHVSSNMYYFCTGSKSRIFKNINLTFFDLLNSVNLLNIFLNVFMKKCTSLNNEFCSKYKFESFFDYSHFYAEFIPILIFLSNIIIFNNDDYFLLYSNKGDLSTTCNMYKILEKRTNYIVNNCWKAEIETNNEEGYNKKEISSDNATASYKTNYNFVDNISNVSIYFIFLKYFKKLLTFGNYFVQVLICRIITNVYLHIYLKLKKENLIFNFLNKVVINAVRKKKKNCYLLLFIEFVRRKETTILIDENKRKFRKMFFQFLSIFIKSNAYSVMLLILQILNILYSKIPITINKNVVVLLFNKISLYDNDMYIPVLINEFLMKITKTVNNFVSILDIYLSINNENYIESLLYNWLLNIKKRDKKEFQIKENELNKFSDYNSFKFFTNYNKKESIFITKKGICNRVMKHVYNEDRNQDDSGDIGQSVDEYTYIYLYLLLFEIIYMYDDNINIKKYCFSIILTVIKYISLENLFLFETMKQYYLKNVGKNYLDKYIISYSYLMCVKFFTSVKKEDREKGVITRCLPRGIFFKNIFDYIEQERKNRLSLLLTSGSNLNTYIYNFVYFYFLIFMNFFSLLYNKNSVTYTKYFIKAFLNYGVVEYNYDELEKEEKEMSKMSSHVENNHRKYKESLSKKEIFVKYYSAKNGLLNMKMEDIEKIENKRERFDMTYFANNNNCTSRYNYQMVTNNYMCNEDKEECNNISIDSCTKIYITNVHKKYSKWYKNDLNKYIQKIVYNKIIKQNITVDIIYIKNPLKHVRKYNLFTSFFIVLYSCIIFMLNDENELIRYKTKIVVLDFMNKNLVNISKYMKDMMCCEFFIYYISKFYSNISLYILTFCIYQTKGCIKNSFYYNPIKLFDQEKYNLYINNILLNHLFLFYYLYNIIMSTQKGACCMKYLHDVSNMQFNSSPIGHHRGRGSDNRIVHGHFEEVDNSIGNIDVIRGSNRNRSSNGISGSNINRSSNNNNCSSNSSGINEAKFHAKNKQCKTDVIDFYVFIDTLSFEKKEKTVNDLVFDSIIANISKYEINLSNHDIYLLNYRRTWKKIISNLRNKMYNSKDYNSVNSDEQQYITVFLSALRMHTISDIKRSLNDYLLLLHSEKKLDLFDSNILICLSNLFNKIIILLINLYIFFQKNIVLYYNSYFYDEINIIKTKTTFIYNTFKLTRYEINPFLLKTMELLLSILNSTYLKNNNFFSDIYTLLYSLKISI
ncbi:hypothetical protein MKS88_005446 [Plasmodium brasilianum]|uniref:Uncharacterized protein n=1 Tax=Plasmodium brasilianum TaxID=5824 RepID=A0ACB9Y304_PLABR|nr:hypothetical protein MKS88_005446 [Plasmodium brasilianum]